MINLVFPIVFLFNPDSKGLGLQLKSLGGLNTAGNQALLLYRRENFYFLALKSIKKEPEVRSQKKEC